MDHDFMLIISLIMRRSNKKDLNISIIMYCTQYITICTYITLLSVDTENDDLWLFKIKIKGRYKIFPFYNFRLKSQ